MPMVKTKQARPSAGFPITPNLTSDNMEQRKKALYLLDNIVLIDNSLAINNILASEAQQKM